MLFELKRIDEMEKLIEASVTPVQRKTREAIFERLKKYIMLADSDEEFYAMAWNDFPVWCLSFINDDSDKPFFLSKWQTEYANIMKNRKYVWGLCSRKVGKSTLLALKNLHDLCGPLPKRIICFAPTLKQDYVFDKMNKYLTGSPYLFSVFGRAGSVTRDYIRLTNGSSCENRTVGLTTKGELIRGEYGDIVTVDEVQKIEESVMNQVIRPIIADAYSEKKFRIIGTPNLYTNPNLEKNWATWQLSASKEDSEYGVIHVDWIRGVEEGCLDEKYVLGEKENLPPDDFAMEYEARFPEQGGRYFPMELLEDAIVEDTLNRERKNENDYVMAVDFAAFSNRTQILVGEFDRKTFELKYVDWKEIDPKAEKIDYENQIEIIKNLFWKYDCHWICPDSTSNQDALIRMLVTPPRAIPPGRFYTSGDRLGYVATDILNDQMWKNHRQQLLKRRIKIPGNGSKEFKLKNRWIKEHNELNVKMIRNGNLIKLEEPLGGYKDLAVTAGMLSLYIQKAERTKPSFQITSF